VRPPNPATSAPWSAVFRRALRSLPVPPLQRPAPGLRSGIPIAFFGRERDSIFLPALRPQYRLSARLRKRQTSRHSGLPEVEHGRRQGGRPGVPRRQSGPTGRLSTASQLTFCATPRCPCASPACSRACSSLNAFAAASVDKPARRREHPQPSAHRVQNRTPAS